MLCSYGTLSEIKLKRTDTTLDLSQKAKRAGEEKKKILKIGRSAEYLKGRASGPCGASQLVSSSSVKREDKRDKLLLMRSLVR